ncbi:putative MFS family arabinose efflux permease [Stackebrandtia endophytica]|uniref:Putative MFS family arabinose efflux permease n=1 Tax=Stackebrandtia endophytica TaxID=1496996 RepID=A0A543AX58_9ACTN|nr:MFS transporter [Stackebrandtia endophytica]TQL77130.1 putative MFS family arabinose efflux permease [Stackebrandtia endophytica]
MRQQLASTFESLKVRNYRLFASGQVVSLVGRWMQIIAIDWLVLEMSGDSGTALGFVMAIQFLPVLMLSLVGGKLADRYDKRRLLLVANIMWLILSTMLATMVVSGLATLWHIFVFAGLLGVVNALETPVRQSFVSEMVEPKLLPNALALSAATFNAARIIGPAVAGGLIALFGSGTVIAINAVAYLAPLVCLLMMASDQLHRAKTKPTDTRISEGLRYTARRPDLLLPLALMFVIGGLGFNFPITLALLAKTVFNTGPETFGILTTMLAAGALVGALASSKRRERPSSHVVMGAAAMFGILEIVVAFSPTFWAACLLLLPTGFFMIYVAQAANQRVQLGVAPQFRGRVMALYILVFLGSTPVFAPLIGWLGEVVGPRSGLWIGGVAGLLAAITAFAVRCRKRDVQISVNLRPRPQVRLIEPERPTPAEQPA